MKWEDKTSDGTPVKIFMEDRGDGAILGAILLEHGVWVSRVWEDNGDPMFIADKDRYLVPKATKKTLYSKLLQVFSLSSRKQNNV